MQAQLHTATQKITGPLRGRWSERGWIKGVEGRGGLGDYGAAPHKGSPEIAPFHNETCHSVYEIMSNWKHCSHCAPVTGSIVQIALSPHLSFSIDAARLFLAIVATLLSLPLFLCLSISPSVCIVIISLLICFLFRVSFHSPADLLFIYLGTSLGSAASVHVCVWACVRVCLGDKNRKQDKIVFWDEIKPLHTSQREILV